MVKYFLGIYMALLAPAVAADHVILISVDGLRPVAIEQLIAAGELPAFRRMQAEGAWTHNARTDYNYTYTVPNHVSMVTGRTVLGVDGHNYTNNGSPQSSVTLHSTKGSYVHSIFDVAHDHGLATAVHRSKSKLVIINQSYVASAGAEDTVGEDDGRAKIDIEKYAVSNSQAKSLVDEFEADILAQDVNLAFLHLIDPDPAGHGSRWDTPGYLVAIRRIDGYLGRLLQLVENSQPYAGRTTIILTADHGGAGSSHGDETEPENFVIPFYVWGADVPVSGDLYAVNSTSRTDPGNARPDNQAATQPIRNGDSGNLALYLLGLPAIPNSTINADQDLLVASASDQIQLRLLAGQRAQLRWAGDTPVMVQSSPDMKAWNDVEVKVRTWVDPLPIVGRRFYRTLPVPPLGE